MTSTRGSEQPYDVKTDATDVSSPSQGFRVCVPYDRYEVTVELTDDWKFVSIVEVAVTRDFLSHAQRVASSGYHDVESFYEEE